MKSRKKLSMISLWENGKKKNKSTLRYDWIFTLGEKHRKQSVVKNDLLLLTTDCHCLAFPSKQKHMLRWKYTEGILSVTLKGFELFLKIISLFSSRSNVLQGVGGCNREVYFRVTYNETYICCMMNRIGHIQCGEGSWKNTWRNLWRTFVDSSFYILDSSFSSTPLISLTVFMACCTIWILFLKPWISAYCFFNFYEWKLFSKTFKKMFVACVRKF